MAALATIGALGAVGTVIAGLVPYFTKKATDVSGGILSNIANRVGFPGITVETIQTQEDKIEEDLGEKFLKMTDSLRRALYTKYMVETYLPNALKTRSEGKITNIDDIYSKIDELKADPFLNKVIFEEFNGFLKYRTPYIRIMDNFLSTFKRLDSLKKQIEKLIRKARDINSQKLDIPPEQLAIKGGDFPDFVRSEISLLYEEFIRVYADYNQYVDRLSNFYKLIQRKGFNELDVFQVAKTDIAEYVGEDKGVLVWSTKDNVTEANKIIDELNRGSLPLTICLTGYNSYIDSWLGQIKSGKGPVVTSVRGLIEAEKKQIQTMIAENVSIMSDIDAIKTDLVEILDKDKLDDAKSKLQTLKDKNKRFKALNDSIDILESRLANYVNTINNSREASLSFVKCVRTATTVESINAPAIGSNISMGSNVGSSSTVMPLPSAPSANIQSKLASINFASATDKDEAIEKINAFREILDIDLSDYLIGVYNDYEIAKNMSIMMNSASDLFGANRVKIFGTIDNRPVNNIINKVVKN